MVGFDRTAEPSSSAESTVDRRAITFVLLSTAVIFTWITIERVLFPPPPPANRLAQEETGEGTPAESPTTPDEATTTPSTESESTADTAAPFAAESTLVSLGSLAEDSPYRMLVTFDSRGGSVRRIELTDRMKDASLRFKKVDDRAGYLGNLEVSSVESGGVRVGLVGPGSPAASAVGPAGAPIGLAAGDVLAAFDGQPLADAGDWFRRIDATRAGDEVVLGVRRGEATLDYRAKLIRRPIEVVSPLPERTSDPSLWHRPSFVTTIGNLTQGGLWRPIKADLESRDWAVEPSDDPDVVAFRYELNQADLDGSKLVGPITVIKRYRLARRTDASPPKTETFDRSFHLDLEFEVRSASETDQTVAIRVGGPTGVTDEGWWYINKIHGRSTAVFYSAGFRDLVGASEGLGFRFLGGPEIVSNELTENAAPLEIFPQGSDATDRQLKYVGIDTQYFNVALMPRGGENDAPIVCYAGIAEVADDLATLDKKERRRADITFSLTTEGLDVGKYDPATGDGAAKVAFTIFAGPKFPTLLDDYGLEDTVSYGWFAAFSKPLVSLLHLFDSIVGNYGLAIVMLTILVRAAMIPISRKAAINAQMMQHLQPEMKKIAEQYKDDMEKRSRAQQELFRRYKYNPMGGCLLMFLQLPIFLGLYRGLSVDIQLRDQPLIPGVDWCSNLAGPDRLLMWRDWMPFLTHETGWLGPYLNVLPIITIVLFLVQQKMFMPPALDEQQRATQKMMTFMMVFMGLMFFKVPSGLCIYFITSSLWGIIERKLLPKPSIEGKLASLGKGNDDSGAAETPAVEEAPRSAGAARARLEEQRRRERKKKDR